MSLYVAGLWRYPVKTLAGERLPMTTLTAEGVPFDRIVQVHGPEGVRTSRRHHRLLGLLGPLGDDGRPLVNGHPWDSPDALALVKGAAGADAWLEADTSLERFDVLPLLVATDGAVSMFGRDIRRLRPNLLIAGVAGMAETTWEEAQLEFENATVFLDSLRARCPMTTVDPDTLARDPGVLKDIGRRFGGRLAINAAVIREGTVRVGERVQLARQPGSG